MSQQAAQDALTRTLYAWCEFVPVAKGPNGEDLAGDIVIPEGAKRGRIRGIASVESTDQDGETVIQKGLRLEKGAPITLEHPKGIFNTIGEVVEVRSVEKGGKPATEIDADLFLEDPVGKLVFQKAVTWHNADAAYRMGFSIEGFGALAKGDKSQIIKTLAHSVAVTMAPRHPDAQWSPVFAKGSVIPMAWHILAKSGVPGAVGYPTQAIAATGGLGIVVPQTANVGMGGGNADPLDHADVSRLATMAGLTSEDLGLAMVAKSRGITRSDLDATYVAKGRPEFTFQQAQDAVLRRFHNSDGGMAA